MTNMLNDMQRQMRVMFPASAPIKDGSIRRPLLVGMWAIMIGIGGFVLFAALAPMATAVIAPGTITSAGGLQKVQHLEGGTVRDLRVHEGERVRRGQLLLRLDQLAAAAEAQAIDAQGDLVRAVEARLLAERVGAGDVLLDSANATVAGIKPQALADQRQLLADRRAALNGQEMILRGRIDQASAQVSGIRREREGLVSQISFIQTELRDIRALFEKGLVTKPRLFALERERARLAGGIGRADAEIARANDLVQQARQELAQVRDEYNAKLSEELANTRGKLAELGGKSRLASDVLARVLIRAPVDGVVQALQVTGEGQVVAPGAPLMEIAPEGGGLLVNARVRPAEVDGLRPGMPASFRLNGLPGRTTPVIQGRVLSVSRDRLIDASTGEPYFLLRGRFSTEELDQSVTSLLSAGMPVEVIVSTGDRTLLDYLLRPLIDAFSRAGREA